MDRATAPSVFVLIFFAAAALSPATVAQEKPAKRAFTVADDIGFAHFPSTIDAYCIAFRGEDGVRFSPDGEFLAVLTARGRLEANQVEESLRFYRVRDVKDYLARPGQTEPPVPAWEVKRSAKEETIVNYQWLADSSGVAMRERTGELSDTVVLLDLHKRSIETFPFQPGMDQGFEIIDTEHYVYGQFDPTSLKELEQKQKAELEAPMRAFSGDSGDLLEPDSPWVKSRHVSSKRKVWAATGGPAFELKYNGRPLADSDIDASMLILSPDGLSAITKLRVNSIPASWERLFPPSYAGNPNNSLHAGGSAQEFVVLDLRRGTIRHLTNAPIADDAGWWAAGGRPSWSSDGSKVILPGTFLESKDNKASRPCVAVIDIVSNERTCVEILKGRKGDGSELEEGYHQFSSASFVGRETDLIQLQFNNGEQKVGTEEYRRTSDGHWQLIQEANGLSDAGPDGLRVTLQESFNETPTLVASRGETSRLLLDPNPQFKDIDLGAPRIYTWKDEGGRVWEGGLYLPRNYQPGQRYPLVIQTHGFTRASFLPAGSYPTAFAARALAGAGIVVLQVGGGIQCGAAGPDEAHCEVAGFESGTRALAADGLVDLQRVGYIGFSRSCWYGMEMLTNGSLRLKAALLHDGIMADYFQFVLYEADSKTEIGAKPFGDGLETWFKRSPGFHLDKITAPVLLGTQRRASALEMWQPYTGLRYLGRPVEMGIINTDEHVITNPVERLASQGLTVDWFRFWLQDYEDPDPAKAEQYKRWRELRTMQEENDKKAAGKPRSNQ